MTAWGVTAALLVSWAYFGGYLTENYLAAQEALALDEDDLARLARNGIEATFLDADRKAALLVELDTYLSDQG